MPSYLQLLILILPVFGVLATVVIGVLAIPFWLRYGLAWVG